MPNALTVAGLRKSYGTVQAVRDVSFTVGQGEIVALLGPNGAGKTTTLEILEGFRRRDGGVAEVLGLDPGDRSTGRELRERTGLVLQDIAVEPYLTVRETIAREAGYYAAPRGVAEVISLVGLAGQERRKVRTLSGGQKRRLDLALGLVGLAGLERRKVRTFSGGQKRRLDLALGLIGNPELLFLDEPTTGFDAAARREAWQLVRDLRTAGTTILLTTHDLDEAQTLADRLVLLSGGVVVAEGRPAELGGRDRSQARITFTLPDGYPVTALPLPATARPDGLAEVETGNPTAALYQLTGWAMDRGTLLDGLTVTRPSLEDTYLRLTSQGGPAGAPERTNR